MILFSPAFLGGPAIRAGPTGWQKCYEGIGCGSVTKVTKRFKVQKWALVRAELS
jgi:hypothetical protein